MPAWADIHVAAFSSGQFSGAGTNYIVQTPAGVLYFVFINDQLDVEFRKSTDGGITWSMGTIVFAGSATNLAVWYDRWSNISGDLIHCAYTESATDDTLYRTINAASSDALSTQTSIFAGTSTASNGFLSITRAVGGNVYCRTTIDAGAEGGFYRLPNANVPNGAWDAARTINEANATSDQIILLPDFDAADNQDILGIFIDASANQIDRIAYDDSGNSWSLTNIASVTEGIATTAFPHFNIAIDIANTRFFLIFWNAIDTANADLQAYIIDASTITALTDVVTNSTDDQGLCALAYDSDTGKLTAYYGGITTGGETFPSAMNIYKKVSTDAGSTWGAETKCTQLTYDIGGLYACPRYTSVGAKPMGVMFAASDGSPNSIRYTAPITHGRVSGNIGI